MNDFTKAIYEDLGIDINKPFNEQIGNKNKDIFCKIDKLLNSNEYKCISNKLPIEDSRGFLDYVYDFFGKSDDYIGAIAKKRFKESRKSLQEHIEKDYKKINDFREYINIIGRIKRNNDGKVVGGGFSFSSNTDANHKLINMANFIDELLEDLKRKNDDYQIFTQYKYYKKKTIAKTIIDELKTYNIFTKRELENFSTRLNTINR